MNMQANTGESIYAFTQRAMKRASLGSCEVLATHNTHTIRIYPHSCEYDILDKFTMQRCIDNLKGRK